MKSIADIARIWAPHLHYSKLKIGVAEGNKDHGRRVLTTILVKIFGTAVRALLVSRTVPNVLSKEFVDRLGVDAEKTKRRITGVPEEKTPVFGILKDVPVHLDEKVVRMTFPVVEGLPYDVIVGDLTMETMEGVLELGNGFASFFVDGDKIELPMEPDYVHENPGYKAGTDTEDYISAKSAGDPEEGRDTDSDTMEEELILMINGEGNGARVVCTRYKDGQRGSKDEHLVNGIYPGF